MIELKKYPIMMKTGLIHWVAKEVHDKAQDILANQSGHQFIKIKELDITINTANIEGVYNDQQFEEYKMIKQGMWQCEYKEWHTKGKRTCYCKEESLKKMRQAMRSEEMETSPLTHEEQERASELMKENKEILILRGVFNGEVRKETRDRFIQQNPNETINPKATII